MVLISLDTLRADHVGCYGSRRPTTPRIDGWARTGVVFEAVEAPANSTLPSHMSVLTSLRPEVHGVVDREEKADRVPSLAPRWSTLAQRLRGAGYETAAFVRDCVWLDPRFGFERGFDVYRVLDQDARGTNESAVFPWLRQRHDRPFFLFVHYYDIHSDWTRLPYESPAPFRGLFTSGYRGRFDGCGDGVCATAYLQRLNDTGAPLSRDDLDYIEGLYDEGVAYTDAQVGRLLDELRERGLAEDTVVLLIGDHGEEFREHGLLGHCGLHEDTIRVPLIAAWPGRIAPGRVARPVQTLDVLPTVLDLVGLRANGDEQGVSRAPELHGGGGREHEPLFSIVAWGSELSVRRDAWKLILDSANGRRELYDLSADPGERRDLSAQRPDLADELSTVLRSARDEDGRRRAAAPPVPRRAKTPEEIERLRSLGYVR